MIWQNLIYVFHFSFLFTRGICIRDLSLFSFSQDTFSAGYGTRISACPACSLVKCHGALRWKHSARNFDPHFDDLRSLRASGSPGQITFDGSRSEILAAKCSTVGP